MVPDGNEYVSTVILFSNHVYGLIVVILSNFSFHRGIIIFSVVDGTCLTFSNGANVSNGKTGNTFSICVPLTTLCCCPKNVLEGVVRKHPGFITYILPVEISVLLFSQCRIESTSSSKDTKL